MECNKEEASRAKDLAEKRLHQADFFGAKRMALKAQQLFPGLENVSQLLAVCEVHCCASVKINGDTDWYGVLQVEPTADDMVLKKQYRKLALLLHPDKNKFAGAEAAFKIIGEAQMILVDQVKRSLHDKKRKSVYTTSSAVPKKGEPPKKTNPFVSMANKENTGAPPVKKNPQHDLSKKDAPVRGETSIPLRSRMHPQRFSPRREPHVTNNYHSVPGRQTRSANQQQSQHQQQQAGSTNEDSELVTGRLIVQALMAPDKCPWTKGKKSTAGVSQSNMTNHVPARKLNRDAIGKDTFNITSMKKDAPGRKLKRDEIDEESLNRSGKKPNIGNHVVAGRIGEDDDLVRDTNIQVIQALMAPDNCPWTLRNKLQKKQPTPSN